MLSLIVEEEVAEYIEHCTRLDENDNMRFTNNMQRLSTPIEVASYFNPNVQMFNP